MQLKPDLPQRDAHSTVQLSKPFSNSGYKSDFLCDFHQGGIFRQSFDESDGNLFVAHTANLHIRDRVAKQGTSSVRRALARRMFSAETVKTVKISFDHRPTR